MIYADFKIMLRDITGYIRATGATVLVWDDPMNGYLGFITEDQKIEWKTPIQPLISRHLFRQELPKSQAQALQSAAGRAALVQSLVEQAKEGVITDPDYIAHLEEKWRNRVDGSPRTPHSICMASAGRTLASPCASSCRRRSGMAQNIPQSSHSLARKARLWKG